MAECTCAASPASSTRPARYRSASRVLRPTSRRNAFGAPCSAGGPIGRSAPSTRRTLARSSAMLMGASSSHGRFHSIVDTSGRPGSSSAKVNTPCSVRVNPGGTGPNPGTSRPPPGRRSASGTLTCAMRETGSVLVSPTKSMPASLRTVLCPPSQPTTCAARSR